MFRNPLGDVRIMGNIAAQQEAANIYETAPYTYASWTPTLIGFSANPSGIYRYVLIGKMCTLMVYQYANGTSSGANSQFSISIPFQAATIANMVWRGFAACVDGGVNKAGACGIWSGATDMGVYTDTGLTLWGTGAKSCALELTYMIA